jgi:hypothetical protein
MKNTLVLFIFFLFIAQVNSQEYASKNYINSIYKSYNSSLNLATKESKEFRKILLKFNTELYKIDSKRNQSQLFNKILKFHTIKIFELLSSVQFKIYKELVLEIEPYKKYKL